VQLRTQEASKGNKSYAEAFEQLKINVAEFAGMNTEQKFEAIARAQANATDKQMAFANVARILGERAGPELNEVLKKLATEGLSAFEKAARDAGQVLDASTIKSLDKASDTLAAFSKAITVLAAKAIEPILPILIKFTNFVSRNAEEVARGLKNIVAFAIGFKSASIVIPVVTGDGKAVFCRNARRNRCYIFAKRGDNYTQELDACYRGINRGGGIIRRIEYWG